MVNELKRTQLECVAMHRNELRCKPHLRWLFFEITNQCNLYCKHCGSKCSSYGQMLELNDIKTVLESIKDEKPSICLTGGEPMMHPFFFDIANSVKNMGFLWGMTTNGTLINDTTVEKLKNAGMSTISVSLDGMEEHHDLLRNKKGAWKLAVNGITTLIKAGYEPQVTTVVYHENFQDIIPLYDFLNKIGVKNWRPINVEPIGRACESNNMLLTSKELADLILFIRKKRFEQNNKINITYGCSHYLGIENERMVRDHYFLCGAGILTASVRSNGDICACLDIENLPKLVQGNIKKDNFMDVWQKGFYDFRRDRTEDCEKCLSCSERFFCGGDSAHTWDYQKNTPKLCYKDFCLDLGS